MSLQLRNQHKPVGRPAGYFMRPGNEEMESTPLTIQFFGGGASSLQWFGEVNLVGGGQEFVMSGKKMAN